MSGIIFNIVPLPAAIDLINYLRGLTNSIKDLRKPFANVGEALLLSHSDRFKKEVSPQGVRWKDNADSTILAYARKKGGYKLSKKTGKNKINIKGVRLIGAKKILRDSGTLQDTLSYQVSPLKLVFGTSPESSAYARVQQFGGGKNSIPARPYLGLSIEDKNSVREKIRNHLLKSWGVT